MFRKLSLEAICSGSNKRLLSHSIDPETGLLLVDIAILGWDPLTLNPPKIEFSRGLGGHCALLPQRNGTSSCLLVAMGSAEVDLTKKVTHSISEPLRDCDGPKLKPLVSLLDWPQESGQTWHWMTVMQDRLEQKIALSPASIYRSRCDRLFRFTYPGARTCWASRNSISLLQISVRICRHCILQSVRD